MSILGKLKEGSYRGIQFYYQSSTQAGGFKVAEHVYPGSNNFVVEQLGEVPKKFNMALRIPFARRDAFDIALNTPGPGLLSHPMFGNFVVKVTTLDKSDTIDDLGLYDYNVEFAVELGLIIPTLETISLSQISKLRANVLEKVTLFIKDKFNVGI